MDSTTPPPIPQRPPPEERVRIGPIIRDVIIVWILTAMGGIIAGAATGGPQQDAPRFMVAVAISNFLLGIVAFTIVGCLAPFRRWQHLAFVALGAWFTSLINVALFGVSIPQWIGAAVFMANITAIGGGISYLFKKDASRSA
jgi:hypothetical protein